MKERARAGCIGFIFLPPLLTRQQEDPGGPRMDDCDETMDVIGYPCPIPMMKVLTRLKEMEAGQVLEIVSDQMDIRKDAEDVCQRTGDELMDMEEEGGLYRVRIRKGDR